MNIPGYSGILAPCNYWEQSFNIFCIHENCRILQLLSYTIFITPPLPTLGVGAIFLSNIFGLENLFWVTWSKTNYSFFHTNFFLCMELTYILILMTEEAFHFTFLWLFMKYTCIKKLPKISGYLILENSWFIPSDIHQLFVNNSRLCHHYSWIIISLIPEYSRLYL
jgi:hypothetical protein